MHDILATADIIPMEQYFHKVDKFLDCRVDSRVDFLKDLSHCTYHYMDTIKDCMVDLAPISAKECTTPVTVLWMILPVEPESTVDKDEAKLG